MRYAHWHVEVVQEDDELLAPEGAEFILRTLFHGLLYRGLRRMYGDGVFLRVWFRVGVGVRDKVTAGTNDSFPMVCSIVAYGTCRV